jgi:hypothetical protein
LSHRLLRSAATLLLASAPLLAAAPAQAAARQPELPCEFGVEKIDGTATSTVTLSIDCREKQIVGMRITANGVELASLGQAVEADVQQTVSVTVPRVPQVCITLSAIGQSTTVCTPAAVTLPAPA